MANGVRYKLESASQAVRFGAFLHSLLAKTGKPHWVEVSEARDSRTVQQNAYLWRAVYGPLVASAGHTAEEWHEYFCGEHWGWQEVHKPGGRVEQRPVRTTTRPHVLSKADFAEFVDFVQAECAERGVFVEEPWNDN